ncbi:MAG: hypothetical protein IJK00_04545 [Clostridia bacterium]|nr:hypothetical protein [Clostridia bacterium]MBR6136360.1 hypothetical protein [Clostridia bacterium]
MRILKEEILTEMALIGFIDIKGKLSMRVGVDSDLGKHNETYIKLFNKRVPDKDTKLIRLSFKENAYYEHKGAPLWNPSRVPFKEVKEWLTEKSNYSNYLTNWQYAIMMWNRESEYMFTEEEFINGDADKKYGNKDNPRYVLSTTPIPDWKSSTIVNLND